MARYAYYRGLHSSVQRIMKRILIFSLSYYPKHIGGAEVAIKEITDRISGDDIEFHIVCNRYDSTLQRVEKMGNVLVHRIGIATKNPTMADLSALPLNLNKPLFQFLAAAKAIQLHRKHQYDAVWAMMAHACGVPAALFKMMFPKVPYILTLQEGDPLPHIERVMRPLWPLFARAFTKADRVQAISHFLGAWARARGFKGQLEIIPNGVGLTHFAQEYPPEELQELKNRLGKKEGDVYLITTSRLVHKNAVDDVIRALAKLPAPVHFLVLGTGPDEAKLRALAESLGLQGRVQFVGQVDHRDMPKYLKASDIFIRPSRSEGMGNSFIEAMAAGLPVIATHEGGIPDFLFDEKRNPEKATTGWAVDANAPEQIADAISDIICRPEKVKEVCANARVLVESRYTWDIVTKAMRKNVFSVID